MKAIAQAAVGSVVMVTLLVMVSGSAPLAQAPGGTRDSLPQSWFGVWSNAAPPPGFPPVENSKAVQESGYIYSHLQPWAQQRYETTEWAFDDTGARCQLVGIFRQGTGNNSTFRWMEAAPGKIYKTSGTYEQTGLHPIYFNSPHPPNLRPLWNGDARARWEGETLVVDITGFNDQSWLNTDRWPHTEALHVIERYRLVGDGSYLELRVFLDDYRAFASPMTYTRYYRKAPEPVRSTENICNPQEEGENLWWERYRLARDDQKAALDDFMRKTLAASPGAAAYSGVARVGAAGGGRGGRGGGGVGEAAAVAIAPMDRDDAMRLRRLGGAWHLAPAETPLAGGVKPAGTFADLPLTPAGIAAAKTHDVANDPAKFCQSIGPFRMLARSGNAFELLPTAQGAVMVFESVALGNKRDIVFGRDHLATVEPNWHGDSIGRFDGDTLVVDTVGFNDRTWLNDAAAQHGPKLHMLERYRLVPATGLLEVQVTIDDPDMLQRPYSYTRYYQHGVDIAEDFCVAEIVR
jgi:hypothetical protein